MATNNSDNIPTGTLNTVLQGQGVGTTPAFSTSTYPTTNATGDLIFGSASNVYSNLAIAALPGQYLDYNGTNLEWYTPLSRSFLFDDFITGTTSSSLNWTNTSSGTGATITNNTTLDSGHPGTLQLNTGTTTTGQSFLQVGNGSNNSIILGGAIITVIYVIKMDTLSNGTDTFSILAGLAANSSAGAVVNGVYFSYNDTGAIPDWFINTTKASSSTSTDTSVAANTNFTTLRFDINAAGTSVSYQINGSSVGTIATNIPTVAVSPTLWILKSAGTTARTVNIDMFYMYQVLSSNR